MKTKTLLLVPALIAVLNSLPAGRVRAQAFTTLHSFTPISETEIGIVIAIAGKNTITNPITGAQQFFRLIQ